MFAVRDLMPSDEQLLATATLENLNWAGPRFTAAQVRDTPEFVHYWAGPPGPRDLGLVVEDRLDGSADGSAIGVAWLRHFPACDPGYGFVDTAIPELSIWVRAAERSRGIGGALLDALLVRARSAGLVGVSLSVEAGNPARTLYERTGFVPAGPGHDAGTLLLMF